MSTPHLYFLCEEYDKPSGGIRKCYRHVDVLNANGFSASVLHHTPGFRCTWFPNRTAVSYTKQLRGLRGDDVLVVPEVYGPQLDRIGGGARTVIFNQNAYFTFWHYSYDPVERETAYRAANVIGTIVVSEDSRQYLEYAFPGLRVLRVHNSVDPEVFAFEPLAGKKRQVCFMPRKHADEALQVINLLKFRGALDGFEVVPIDGKSERETAAVLRQSLAFLSFGYPEGCPLSPMEAMACGCITIGYDGMGGREYFTEEFGFPVPAADVVQFARTAERVLAIWRDDSQPLADKATKAAAFITETYSPEREEGDVLRVWTELLR